MSANGNKFLTLDDLSVGQKFCSGSHTLTTDEIKTFAREYDSSAFSFG